ncbi:MAG: heme biosynthesis HemY N-terminal domain-containing protein [Salinarimonas sp.]
MWRVLLSLAVVAALAAGAIWLADQPGRVAFVWNGVSYSVGLAVAAILLVIAVFAFLLLEALVRWLFKAPEKMAEASVARKRRKGLVALSRGMVAVGAGDEAAARRYAREVQKYLRPDEPLVLLLRAQAAQMSGDRHEAETAFRAMAENDETRVLGLRGLHVEARQRDDRDAALAYAQEAARLAPAATWANEAVLESHVARGDWTGALDVVERRAALGLVDKATAKRQRAVLLTADALSRGEKDEETALQKAKEALRLAPDLTPAAALAGRILSKRLELRKAAKILETAWKTTPHPEIADVYTHLRIGDSTHDRLQRAEKLATLSTWSIEGRLALARAALDARDFARARQTIEPLVGERPSVRVCLTMADIERAEHGPTVKVREWLARAVHAPRDKAWVADGIVSDRWAPMSPATGRLDAFEWKQPPEVLGAMGTTVVDSVVGDLDSRPDDALERLEAPVYHGATLAPVAKALPPRTEDAQVLAPEPKPSVMPSASSEAAREAPPETQDEPERETPPARPASPVVAPAAVATGAEEPVRPAAAAPRPAPAPAPAPAPSGYAARLVPQPPPQPAPAPRPQPAPAPVAAAPIAQPGRETPAPAPRPEPVPRPQPAPAAVAAKPFEPIRRETPAPAPAAKPEPASEASLPATARPASGGGAAAEPLPAPSEPGRGAWLRRDRDELATALAAGRRVEDTPAPSPAPAPAAASEDEAAETPAFAGRAPDDPGIEEAPKPRRFRLFG